MTGDERLGPSVRTTELPPHLAAWQLPPSWRWGDSGLFVHHRHVQEIVDSFDRSLALVTAPDPAHEHWLFSEAKHLAHRNHPAIPTTYHYWSGHAGNRRGPGYLRRWVTGETVGDRMRREGLEHHGIELLFSGQRHRIDLSELTGGTAVENGQGGLDVTVGPDGKVKTVMPVG